MLLLLAHRVVEGSPAKCADVGHSSTLFLLPPFPLQLQKMVRKLDAMGMMDNTLLVLASDNGGCPSAGGSNYPYRGFKHTNFEGGVRTPALVYSKSESIIPLKVTQAYTVVKFFCAAGVVCNKAKFKQFVGGVPHLCELPLMQWIPVRPPAHILWRFLYSPRPVRHSTKEELVPYDGRLWHTINKFDPSPCARQRTVNQTNNSSHMLQQ